MVGVVISAKRRGSGFGGFCGVLAGEDGETEWPSKYS